HVAARKARRLRRVLDGSGELEALRGEAMREGLENAIHLRPLAGAIDHGREWRIRIGHGISPSVIAMIGKSRAISTAWRICVLHFIDFDHSSPGPQGET